jgi:carboxylate-amine ligase
MALHSANSSPAPVTQAEENLDFRASPSATLGIELELQIVDRETGELAPGALRILQACQEEHLQGVTGEFLLSMLEVKTGVCQDVAEARRHLVCELARARNIAQSLGYELALGGTHPFGRPGMGTVFPSKRYQRIQRRQGWTAYQEPVFGLHVHVGVPDGDTAIGAVNLLVQYLPHLLALSVNSPFWQGIDTCHASSRNSLFRPSALAGLPLYFRGWREFREYFDVMRAAGAIQTTKDIYWDIRPRPHLGTIEFRTCDAPPTLGTALGIAALIRALVIDALDRMTRNSPRRAGDFRTFWLAAQNKWLAGRFGLAAQCTRLPGSKRVLPTAWRRCWSAAVTPRL